MKKLLGIMVLGLLLSGNAHAKINLEKRDLCKKNKYKEVCSNILGKTLEGYNTIAKFRWTKGEIIGLVKAKRGENISLLKNPDPSYKARYTGPHIVYTVKNKKFITMFVGDQTLRHYICDQDLKCNEAAFYFKK
ncbi:MAG: hypothetical protein CMI85_05580 [Candidatus Pelagibacter sp.]|nr:hypothetical protein [Candidatus Pelagibacter sp.]|tara:strand:+ start:1494 stop:1895 length:402 start_codon:yes stop_codon:yes gene_type:complete